MSTSRPRRAKDKGKEPIPPPKRTRKDGGPVEQPDFESRHFPGKRLATCFHQRFMTCKVLDTFYIVSDWLCSLSISNGNLLQLLEKVDWINALTINKNVYPDLVKFFTRIWIFPRRKRIE